MVKNSYIKTQTTINKNMKALFYTAMLVFSLIYTTAQATNITVTTSRNPVALDDSFHLIYEANSSVDDDPDFSPIYKNFDILSSSQSTNMRSVNGSWDLKRTWNLTLIAKQVGKFVVPAISFGKDTSPAIRLTIKNNTSPTDQATIPAKIFLENTIDKKIGWIQSQFIYTVRLLRTVSIANATITEPVTTDPDVLIQLLTEDKYQTTRKGIRYEVFERRYAIFPQKSGPLKIKPVTFEGRINATQSRSLFDQFRISGQVKRLRTKPISVTVNPAPDNINLQNWFPATEVRLIEEWSDDIQNITAGEPVTRTILLAAEGLTGIQLPDLTFDNIAGIKQYPDKPVIDDKKSANGVTGYKQIKIALIPAREGSYTLPEIKLPWWNTKTNKQEIAVIPKVYINVTRSADTDNTMTQPNAKKIAPAETEASLDKQTTSLSNIDNDAPYWKWLSFLFAIAWLITLILYFRKTNIKINIDKTKKPSPSLKQATSRVIKQATNNNPNKIKDALIQWAKLFYDDNSLTNLTQLSAHCSPILGEEVRQLNKTLYSPQENTWHNDNFLNAFNKEQLLSSNKIKQTSTLKPLYSSR